MGVDVPLSHSGSHATRQSTDRALEGFLSKTKFKTARSKYSGLHRFKFLVSFMLIMVSNPFLSE